MKISLSSFIYFNYTFEDAIRLTAEAGFDGIDIWGGRPHAYRRDLSPADIERLKRQLNHDGMVVSSFIPAQFRYPTCLCSNNEVIRRDSVLYIQDSINTAASLGAPLVSVCPGHTLSGQGIEDGWERLFESLNAICEFAASLGVRIAIEPADKYETDLMPTTVEAKRMIDELRHPSLGVLLDTGHANVVGESVLEAVQNLGDRLFHIHVDDNNGQRDQHLIPGEGNFDFGGFFAALQSAGYDGWLGAELSWDYTIDPGPAARLTAQKLREYLKNEE